MKTCRQNISPGISDETEYFAATKAAYVIVQPFTSKNVRIGNGQIAPNIHIRIFVFIAHTFRGWLYCGMYFMPRCVCVFQPVDGDVW